MGSSTSSLSLRILLTSAGVLSVAMVMKLCIPLMLNFAVYDIPVIWSVILSWLRPPYLYVVINGIIIIIAASSRFHHHYNHYHSELQTHPLVNEANSLPPPDLPSEIQSLTVQPRFDILEHPPVVFGFEDENWETKEVSVVYENEIEPPIIEIETVLVNNSDVAAEVEEKFEIPKSSWNSPQLMINSPPPAEKIQSDFIPPVRERPLVSSRFAHQRRTAKINPEGVKSLRVSKAKKHDTLESTWKTITDGRHMPLNRHLRKSDTFENHHHHAPPIDALPGEQVPSSAAAENNLMNKSETFNDRTDYDNQSHRIPSLKNSLLSGGGRLRKEGSLSQDELNRRVEAFIKKFNDDMRLQRQESLQRYMDMINRGAE
ncbi:uncharacterized protein LOC111906747 [Lactuca sativa]|uniref:DUF4408 domain-containing protein n=1 Tax=Lactuca sativa TaxID=4236 RepID=A0A9R1V1X4_LACSA|nr:uncharacterized protein LOC111906747 [Lactuca sativa]KAJ0198562.1 hypothetical protein LSAT_V11C700350470 [Lactuca sativa]